MENTTFVHKYLSLSKIFIFNNFTVVGNTERQTMTDFEGKNGIVTGGTAGIGLQCSKELLINGIEVSQTNQYNPNTQIINKTIHRN